MLLFFNPRVHVALGIPPEFIDNSLVSRPLARDGIDTVVEENGVQLLVLDEATSALDAQTEGIHYRDPGLSRRRRHVDCDRPPARNRAALRSGHSSGWGRITGRGTFEEVRAQVPEFNRQAKLLWL
jgi:hypothetical protein